MFGEEGRAGKGRAVELIRDQTCQDKTENCTFNIVTMAMRGEFVTTEEQHSKVSHLSLPQTHTHKRNKKGNL